MADGADLVIPECVIDGRSVEVFVLIVRFGQFILIEHRILFKEVLLIQIFIQEPADGATVEREDGCHVGTVQFEE